MLDSIFIGLTGLSGYARGLKTISNNVVNLNTPGFKGSQTRFSNLFYSSGYSNVGSFQGGAGLVGHGLNTPGSYVNFSQGELRQTGNDLDLAVDGNGMFVFKEKDGQLRYSRAGQLQFDKDGFLVNQVDGAHLMALDDTGQLTDVNVNGLRTSPAKASSLVKFTGNISSTAATATIGSVRVYDALGGEHNLNVSLTNNSAATPGSWNVSVTEVGSSTVVGSGQILFAAGTPVVGSATLSFTYSPAGVAPIPLTLDFSADVTSFASGNDSTIAVSSQDGFSAGSLTRLTFDQDGRLTASYSNGEVNRTLRLALMQTQSDEQLVPIGGNLFEAVDAAQLTYGHPNSAGFGRINSGYIEVSNVDLSREFSDLIVMQRGYQASSQVISTANDMLQTLFDMKGRR